MDKDTGLKAIVEMNEMYIGGKPRKENVRISEYDRKDGNYNKRGRGTNKDTCNRLFVERDGKVVIKSAEKVNSEVINQMIKENLVIKHKECFADGDIIH